MGDDNSWLLRETANKQVLHLGNMYAICIYLSIHLPIYLPIYLSIYLPIYLSIYLSIKMLCCEVPYVSIWCWRRLVGVGGVHLQSLNLIGGALDQ